MSAMPPIRDNGRGRGITTLAVLALGQAIATGVAAFSTRDVFAALRDHTGGVPSTALALIALSGLAIAILRIVERVIAERVGQSYASDLRIKLFRHFSRVPVSELAQRRRGGLALRFVGDLTAVRNWVSLGIARLISASIVLPIATLVVFAINPVLGIAAALPTLLGLVIMLLLGRRLGSIHRHLRSRRAGLAADMSERIPVAPELRLMGRMQIEHRSILNRTQKMISAAVARTRGTAVLRAVPDAVSGLAAAAVMLMAYRSGASAAQTAGVLAAVGLMIQPMRDLASVWDRHRAWLAANEKCIAVLNKPRVARPNAPVAVLPRTPPRLVLNQLQAKGLKLINATAEPGRKIGIFGSNGAGKSTLLTLAAGLESPSSGEVLIGDRAPTTLGVKDRQHMIAYISADSLILAGSLRRALTMGVALPPDDTKIIQTAKDYGLAHVIERLGGLDGRVAEGGRNLSTGEICRLKLARVDLSESQLLLLDEPDDALDEQGATLVLQLLRKTSATVLVITHNLNIAAELDEIWVLENGRLIDWGGPEEVLREFTHRPIDRTGSSVRSN